MIFFCVRRVLDWGTRQTQSLPCAQAHGKGPCFPCVTLDTQQITNTRQTALFAMCQALAHGELQSSPCAICLTHGEHYSAVTRRLELWRTSLFAVWWTFAMCLALGTRQRLCLPCASVCLSPAHGEYEKKFMFLLPNFFYTLHILFGTLCLNIIFL